MQSLEFATLEPYLDNGELKNHTVGILRQAEEDKVAAIEEEDEKYRLDVRRGLELRLVKKFDKRNINKRQECWFIVDTRWLNAWAEFVEKKDDAGPPGPLSTAELLDNAGKPLPDLRASIDYRELYGHDNSPELARYSVDIYQPQVPDDHYIKIIKSPLSLARINANKIKQKWMRWGKEYMDEDEEEPCCCGLTRDHLEALLFWIFTCSRKRSGRGDISYRNYNVVREGDEENEDDEDDDISVVTHTTYGDAERSYGDSARLGNYIKAMFRW